MPVQARDAATVLLLRDAAGGLEVFLVRRNAVVDFMAGAHVFPGGKVDAADAEPAMLERLRGECDASTAPALYIAAIRETFEESGVLLSGDFRNTELQVARDALRRGEPFLSVLERLGAVLDAGRLVPWTRWVTPAGSPKRFDARFFLAAAPDDQVASHDEHEVTESVWITPGEALQRVLRAEMMVAPATYKCLAVLASYRDVAEAFASVRANPPRAWCPIVREEQGRRLVILSDDPDHPDAYPRMPGPTRMVFERGRFLPA